MAIDKSINFLPGIGMIITSNKKRGHLLSLPITLENDSLTVYYNQSTLPIYYSILQKCTQLDENFIKYYINSKLFKISIENFLIYSDQYENITKILFNNIETVLNKNEIHRKFFLKFSTSNMDIWKINPKNVLKLINLNLISPNDTINFLNFNGNHHLTIMIINRLSQVEFIEQNQIGILTQTLNLLIKMLNLIMNSNNSSLYSKVAKTWKQRNSLIHSLINSLDKLLILFPNLLEFNCELLYLLIKIRPLILKKSKDILAKTFKKHHDHFNNIFKKNNNNLISNFLQFHNTDLPIYFNSPNYLNFLFLLINSLSSQNNNFNNNSNRYNYNMNFNYNTKHDEYETLSTLQLLCYILIETSNNLENHYRFLIFFNNIFSNYPKEKNFIIENNKLFRQYLLSITNNLELLQIQDCNILISKLMNCVSEKISQEQFANFVLLFGSNINNYLLQLLKTDINQNNLSILNNLLNLIKILANNSSIFKNSLLMQVPDLFINLQQLSENSLVIATNTNVLIREIIFKYQN